MLNECCFLVVHLVVPGGPSGGPGGPSRSGGSADPPVLSAPDVCMEIYGQ